MTAKRAEKSVRLLSGVTLVLGLIAAMAGLTRTPGPPIDAADLFGQGVYRRDTDSVAGGAQGSDQLSLCLVLSAGHWAIFGRLTAVRRLIIIGVNTLWPYPSPSLAFGAVAFNEGLPLHVALMALSPWGRILSLQGLALERTPRGLPAFLIAPGGIAAGTGIVRGRAWGTRPGLPLMRRAALLLPMMVLQTIMQLGAGVAFGPEAAASFVGFDLVSGGATWFRVDLPRHVQMVQDA